MTRDDIIKLMRESCDTDKSEPWDNGFWTVTQEELERFAALLKKSVYENEDMFAEAYAGGYAAGAAAEREACAKMFDGEHDAYIALAIRARK